MLFKNQNKKASSQEMLEKLKTIANREVIDWYNTALGGNPADADWPKLYVEAKGKERELFEMYDKLVKENPTFKEVLEIKPYEVSKSDEISLFNGDAFCMHNANDWYSINKECQEYAYLKQNVQCNFASALYVGMREVITKAKDLMIKVNMAKI